MAHRSKTDFSDSESVLKSFMSEMYDWESKYYKRKCENFYNDSEPDLKVKMRKDISEIFSRFVVEGGMNYERIENLVCCEPPEYDQEGDEIELINVNANKVFVVIQRKTGLQSKFRLTLSKKDGRFMVSKREFQAREKWHRTHV